METMLDRYYRVSGVVVNVVAVTALTAAAIFLRSAFAQQIGTKGFIPRKLRVRNNAAGNLWLFLGSGTGAGPIPPAFAALMPAVRVINIMDNIWAEFELPRVEFFANMTCWADAMIAGGSLDIIVEVEESG